jgi:hypothetical protein
LLRRFGQLHAGKSVELDDGRVITSEQVVGKSTPSQRVLILQCTSEALIRATFSHPSVQQALASSQLLLVCHLATAEIVRSDEYYSL